MFTQAPDSLYLLYPQRTDKNYVFSITMLLSGNKPETLKTSAAVLYLYYLFGYLTGRALFQVFPCLVGAAELNEFHTYKRGL
jgi:hypothetical protein